MKYYLYIIFSLKLDRYYVGYTEDIGVRVSQHNAGISKYTSKTNDWEFKYSEEFSSREEARAREQEIQRKKSRKYIEWLLNSQIEHLLAPK